MRSVFLHSSLPLHNVITASRYFLGVLFVFFFYFEPFTRVSLIITTVAIEISDIIDGRVARKLHLASTPGSAFDSMADFFTDITHYICLLSVAFVPLWLVILVFWTWTLMSLVRILGSVRGEEYAKPRLSGKIRGATNGVGIIYFVTAYSLFGIYGIHVDNAVGYSVISLVATVHVVAGLDFLLANRHTVFSLFRKQ